MKITAKSEYGIRAMVELAINYNKNLLQSRDIASRQRIPIRFLEQLLSLLKKSKLIISRRGIKGGYSLIKTPEQINVAQIIEVLDGPIVLQPVEKSLLSELWKTTQECLIKKLKMISLEELMNNYLKNRDIVLYNI